MMISAISPIGAAGSSTSPTRAKISAFAAKNPAVSKDGACVIRPATGIALCVGRMP